MMRLPPWSLLAGVCLIAASCSDSDHDKPSSPHADAAASADAATSLDADAGSRQDASATSEPAEPVDQTPSFGANGLAFDADGKLWLADLFGKQILRLNPDTGEILARFTEEGISPDDVALDAQGRVFWTDWSNGRVGRLDPKTLHNEFVATVPTGANSIAFTDDGRLFIALVLLNHGLYEIDPEGHDEPRLVTDAIPGLNAFDFGPKGHLWGPLEDKIAEIDLDTGEVIATVAEGGYASVRYNEHDHALYGLTNGPGKKAPALHKIDIDDFTLSDYYEPQLAGVDNFAIDADGKFFVTGYDKPQIVVIDPQGPKGTLLPIGAPSER